MSDPASFLNSFAQALSVMTLYPDGHPSRERSIDAAYQMLDGLTDVSGRPSFTFIESEVVYGRDRLRDFKEWDWGHRLVAAGIERLEFERRVSRDEFESFLQEILARLMLSVIDTSESRQMRPLGIRFGAVGVQGQTENRAASAAPALATLNLTLAEEVETLQWMQREVQAHGAIPLIEAEAVVRSLSVAMHGDRRMVLPLLQLKEFDQYTTTHSLNVAVLAMGLAESLGCTRNEVRGFGVAGLLHDIGKIRIPLDVLTKPGKLSEEERQIINRHPVDGARIIMQSDEELDLAAVVAYEHHIMLNGGGYPTMHYGRACALASRLVHVCDVFDALRTKRPYRDAWESEKVFAYLLERAGTEFDPDLVSAFIEMLRKGEAQISVITSEQDAVSGVPATDSHRRFSPSTGVLILIRRCSRRHTHWAHTCARSVQLEPDLPQYVVRTFLVISLIMAKPKPFVQAACVCERFLQEPDNVLSVIRMVDVITLKQVSLPAAAGSPGMPAQAMIQVMDLGIVVALKSGDLTGNFRVSLVMEDPKQNRVPLINNSPVVLKGDHGANLMVRFGLPYNAPVGRYWFDVLWDDEVRTRIPIRLKREEAESKTDVTH